MKQDWKREMEILIEEKSTKEFISIAQMVYQIVTLTSVSGMLTSSLDISHNSICCRDKTRIRTSKWLCEMTVVEMVRNLLF